jgi:predicted RNase H-like nuclease (RuvC/YqgF family)
LEISTYDENGDIKPLEDGEYTIKGVKVVIVDGRVSELPEKDSKIEMENENGNDGSNSEENESESAENSESDSEMGEQPMGNSNDADGRINELTAQVEALQAENEALRAELAELKAVPMAEPVPQRTNMSTQVGEEVPEHIKGTKYEKAYKIFSK